ncbi:MAG: hypothetical protein HY737_02990 [Candidatus Omnitrophica bacterium]|nr:hypothetical protein [Candidatus Omnitrophota bacterium]
MTISQVNGSFGLVVRKGDREFQVWGSESFVKEYAEKLREHSWFSPPLSQLNASRTVVEAGEKSISLAELMKQTNPKKHPERITAMGYYLEKFRGQESFTAPEIVQAYKTAKERFSSEGNIRRDISRCVEKGWIMSIGQRGREEAYVVTKTGDSHIDTLMQARNREVALSA